LRTVKNTAERVMDS